MFFNTFSSTKLSVNIEDITDEILEETDYLESATTGYPRYTEDEALNAAEALESSEDIQMLEELGDGKGLYDIYTEGIGENLDRLDDAELIERPETGQEFVKLTRLSQTYLQYYRKVQRLNNSVEPAQQ